MKPLISIIIPTYNRSHLLGATLDSVRAQTYQYWECIVVDDGSTDVTAALMETYLKKDVRFQFLARPKERPPGGNAARNFGLEKAAGAYIQWFDSDDLMHPQLLEAQLANIKATQKKYSICKHDRFNEDLTVLQKEGANYIPRYGVYFDYLTATLAANLPTILFSREVITGYSLSETLYRSQEFELLQRFFRDHKDSGAFLNKSLVQVRRHAHSITESSTPRGIESALQVILMSHTSLPSSAPMEVRKFLTLKYLKTLYIACRENRGTVLLPYTLKVYQFSLRKSILTIPYIFMIYIAAKLCIVHTSHYKKIYTLYR